MPRHWRILMTEANSSGLDFQEIELRVGGTDQTNPTQAITAATASSYYVPEGLAPRYAFDNTNIRWCTDFSGTLPQWIAYDFGPGADITLDAIMFRPFAADRTPRAFQVQACDDGVSWGTGASFSGLTSGWGTTVNRVFTFTWVPPDPEPVPGRLTQGQVVAAVTAPGTSRVSQGGIVVAMTVAPTGVPSRIDQGFVVAAVRRRDRRTIGVIY